MEERYKDLLSEILSDRLRVNWDKSDKLPSESKEYNRLADECTLIHGFIREYAISVGADITARF